MTATVTGLQFEMDSDSPGAVAVAVMISALTKTGEIPDSVQALPLVVVEPMRDPFLYTLMVVPLASVGVPLTEVALAAIGLVMAGQSERSPAGELILVIDVGG